MFTRLIGFARKLEIRSTKYDTNSKHEATNSKPVGMSDVSKFEFRVCFGFRISKFGLLGNGRLGSLTKWHALIFWTIVAAVSPAAPARADAALDEGLAKLAASVARFMKDENRGSAINVGDFIAPPRLQASGGRGLSESLAAAFKKQDIEVSATAPLQLIGKFTVREEKENASNDFESVALRIRAEVLDKEDETLQAFNISVFGSAALQVPGITVDLPAQATEEEKQQGIKGRIENPQAAVIAAETRASPASPYGVEVIVNRSPRVPQMLGGRAFVPLDRGEEYLVRLHNHSPLEAAVTLTIDGMTMFAFSSEGNFGSQVVVPPGKFADVPGWYMNKSKTAAFVITSYPESAAGKKGVTTNIGTITATFHACWDPKATPPDDEPAARSAESATGLGRPIEKQYEKVNRVVGQPRAVVSVRYNRESGSEGSPK